MLSIYLTGFIVTFVVILYGSKEQDFSTEKTIITIIVASTLWPAFTVILFLAALFD